MMIHDVYHLYEIEPWFFNTRRERDAEPHDPRPPTQEHPPAPFYPPPVHTPAMTKQVTHPQRSHAIHTHPHIMNRLTIATLQTYTERTKAVKDLDPPFYTQEGTAHIERTPLEVPTPHPTNSLRELPNRHPTRTTPTTQATSPTPNTSPTQITPPSHPPTRPEHYGGTSPTTRPK